MNARLATFNIHHGVGTDGRLDLARTAAVIRATGAGLIALQEVDRGLPRSGGADQPAVLAEATGLYIGFSATLRRAGGAYGIALLADEPVDVAFEPLPRLAAEEPRGVQVASWRGLRIVATHLTVRGRARTLQTEALTAIAVAAGAPAIVLGDLNQEARSLRPLREAGFAGGPPAATWGRRQIDHILAGPGVNVVGAWSVPGDASDHRPLVADLIVAGGSLR